MVPIYYLRALLYTYNGRTGTPTRPIHRSQQPIRIGYTEFILQLFLTIHGPSCTFLELIGASMWSYSVKTSVN